MNERQFLLATRNIIRLEDLSAEVAAKVIPQLREIFKEVGKLMRSMPDGEIERQMQYRQMQQRIASLFLPANQQLRDQLVQALGREVEYQMHWADSFMRVAETTQKQVAAANMAQQGLMVGPVVGNTGVQLMPELTRTQLMAIAQDTEVLGKTLEQLFAVYQSRKDGQARDLGPWLKENMRIIDRKVKTGFLIGQTNDEIANSIAEATRTSISQAKAIARTAVMDMSQRAHGAMWDANREVIVAYEYSAIFDYRVCEQCAPWSGAMKRKRDELPRTPRHPNCRCMVLPLTATEWELRKEGPENATFVELVDGEKVVRGKDGKPVRTPSGKWKFENLPRPANRDGEQYYSKPVFVNGKRYWRKVVDVTAREGNQYQMAEFLRNANWATKVQVMGVKRAREFVGLYSQKDARGRYVRSSHDALIKVLPRGS